MSASIIKLQCILDIIDICSNKVILVALFPMPKIQKFFFIITVSGKIDPHNMFVQNSR